MSYEERKMPKFKAAFEADMREDIRKEPTLERLRALALFYARRADKEMAELEERLAAAEADGAAMRQAARELSDAMQVANTHWDVHEELGFNPELNAEAKRVALDAALASDHPGADLLAVVDAAEAVVEAVKTYRAQRDDINYLAGKVRTDEDAEAVQMMEGNLSNLDAALSAALATYDARVQEGKS